MEAHSSYQRDLGGSAPAAGYRQTPPGGPTPADLAPPGTVIRTTYGTGPYVVLAVKPREWTPPEQDEPLRAWSFILTPLACASPTPQGWINDMVSDGGEVVHLFANNEDRIIIDGPAPLDVLEKCGLRQLALF